MVVTMITKAIIPVAGRGRRMQQITHGGPKAMLPLPSGDGRTAPAVHLICAEAASGGIDEVLLVVSPEYENVIRSYFGEFLSAGTEAAPMLPGRIQFATQASPRGSGDAVAAGRAFAGDQPFMLLLGDHLYQAGSGESSCAAQIASAFAVHGGCAMIGVQQVGLAELPNVGVVRGEPIGGDIYRCTDFIEKPTPHEASERLKTPDLPDGEFLVHCGIYVFSPEVFECIELAGARPGDEVELSAAQSLLLQRHPQDYLLRRISGRAYDIGTPDGYARTANILGGRNGQAGR